MLLAVCIPFLPWAERNAWTTFDPRILDNKTPILQMQVSPDGKKLGIHPQGITRMLNIWDLDAKNFISIHSSHQKRPMVQAFSSDGKYFAVGQELQPGVDKKDFTNKVQVEIWDLLTGNKLELQRTAPLRGSIVNSVAFRPNTAEIACDTGLAKNAVEIWDIINGKIKNTLTIENVKIIGEIVFVTYNPDGKYLATADSLGKEIIIWEAETGAPVWKLVGGPEGILKGHIKGITYSPDGKYLASAFNKRRPGAKTQTEKGFIDIWDTTTGQLYKSLQWDSGSRIESISYSADGKYIAALLQLEDCVRIWDVANGKEIEVLRGPVIGSPVVGVAFTADGKYLLVASDRYIKLYDAQKIGKWF